jgi:hypothetical protein
VTIPQSKEFNDEVKRAIDGTIYGILGEQVLRTLYNYLRTSYDITPDEIPYRLDSLFETLERTFGVAGARTLSREIAKRVYYRYNIDFVTIDGHKLQDYLEHAKRVLSQQSPKYGMRKISAPQIRSGSEG